MKTIAALRRSYELTQQELASRLGLSVTSVASWEQGKYDPSARQLRAMSAIFGVDCRDIVLPSDARKPPTDGADRP